MELDEANAGLPPSSPYRKVLRGLMDADAGVREAAFERLERINEKKHKIPKREALGLLRAAVGLAFPPQQFDWNDTAHELIFPLVESPHPELVPIARAAYPHLGDQAKCAVLALFGAVGNRRAAVALVASVREHGWPRVYGRVFTEMKKLYRHADVLFPELVVRAGKNLGGVADALIDALASGKVSRSQVNLEPIAPLITKSLRDVLARVAKHQRAQGIKWRFTERYSEGRGTAGAWLDLAGYLRTKAVAPLLKNALALRDPRLALFAVISILRRRGKVPPAVLERIAACHETREILFDKLGQVNKLSLFPKPWRTWDAFAASHMVEWLIFPTELGREPEHLEQMAVLTHKSRAVYVFRFRDERGPWKAGVAGPFVRRGDPRPLHGHLTFSRFENWSSATPEEHALAIVKNVQAIK